MPTTTRQHFNHSYCRHCFLVLRNVPGRDSWSALSYVDALCSVQEDSEHQPAEYRNSSLLLALVASIRAELGHDPHADCEDRCAVCTTCVDCTLSGDTTAHHRSASDLIIVAWTCSTACATEYEAARS